MSKGEIAKADEATIAQIQKKLSQVIPEPKQAAVFGPLAVGKHVDHLITRNLCQTMFPQTIYWSDFPYAQQALPDDKFIQENHLAKEVFNQYIEEKQQYIRGYKTQVQAMFGSKPIPQLPEIYYIPG
jgi:hypothetical protein